LPATALFALHSLRHSIRPKGFPKEDVCPDRPLRKSFARSYLPSSLADRDARELSDIGTRRPLVNASDVQACGDQSAAPVVILRRAERQRRRRKDRSPYRDLRSFWFARAMDNSARHLA
jgi:hypothetical protein